MVFLRGKWLWRAAYRKYQVKNLNIDKNYPQIIKIKFLENITGLNSVLKFFKKYDSLLNYTDYEEIIKNMNFFLKEKEIKKKYIYYLPSYLRLSYTDYYLNNYNNQINQLQLELESLKKNKYGDL